MPTDYDVIVIGAGLGGLSAATMLAKNGLSVLLLERHSVPGGYATSFVRGRFEFEVALHELSGIGPPERRGSLYRYLDYLGVAEKVEFINLPNLYRSVFPGLDVTLPVGREAFEDTLYGIFPHEKQGIQRFLQRIFNLRSDFVKISRRKAGRSALKMPFQVPHFFRYLPTTWGKVLNRDVKDPLARAVISQYWGYVGLPPSKISFLFFASTLAAYIKRGPAFPRGRSQALSNAFIETFEALDGDVRMNCAAKKIITENGRVTGVLTDQGDEFNAKWIVSNADPITTCRRLIGEEKIPSEFFRDLSSSTLSPSTLNVYLGLAEEHHALGLDEHEIFINEDVDFDRHYEAMSTLGSPPAIAVTSYNIAYPEISPPGTSIVVLTALAYAEPWYALSPADYVDTKNRIADQMITLAQEIAPGLMSCAEVVEVSTPITNMRYAGTMGGSIYGFNQPPRDNMAWRMKHHGPLQGLYFVGAWTRPGAGFEPSMFSGQMAGSSILRRIKRVEEGN
ncbi:MAG: FAD-dependent oxidoreductase [Anaerolineales bacterium]|nr:FAD-dependent oxidoreductase [Anaerolineales bacterium]